MSAMGDMIRDYEKKIEQYEQTLRKINQHSIIIGLDKFQARAVCFALANTWNNANCLPSETEAMSVIYNEIRQQENEIFDNQEME